VITYGVFCSDSFYFEGFKATWWDLIEIIDVVSPLFEFHFSTALEKPFSGCSIRSNFLNSFFVIARKGFASNKKDSHHK
jgi:hypothetical protein